MSSSFDQLLLDLNKAQESARRDAAALKLAKSEAERLRQELAQLRSFYKNDLS